MIISTEETLGDNSDEMVCVVWPQLAEDMRPLGVFKGRL